ncbi:MAG: sigma-54-dependent Fis family transcriptional regulator [Methylococcaceae bacterium]|nr:sigma-54-dependent Fis family transcriptional regulator [Methylococcaceae bacterium]
MAIDYNIPHNVKIIQDVLLVRHTLAFEVDHPVLAWQWMNQSRSVPERGEWVRPEVTEAWKRCLEDYHLPLGNYAHWEPNKITRHTANTDKQVSNIEDLIKQLSHNFTVFLQEAGVMMVLTTADGRLLTVTGEKHLPSTFMTQLFRQGASWQESVLGNNGIGTALKLKQPVAFQGMEHFLSVLHPFTTVGYPLLDDTGNLLAIIGLVSNQQDCMNALFAFLHLICVLVHTNLPLAQNKIAQERVLEKIQFKSAKKTPTLESGISPALELLIQKAVKLQAYKIPILITGESGVGKDHFVNLLKQAGPRKDAPFIAINCASIPRDLIESELFGYESGSFTGARSNGKPGKFMLADKGILFLDEIGDMSFDLQSTLLRVLETSEFTPVGGSSPVRVDVQVVAATNVNLMEAVETGRFRRDLYYRLNGAQIHLPSLREMPDKKALIHHILQRELDMIAVAEPFEICPEVISLIEQHPWPGNIRQLINVIRATLYTASGVLITTQDLPLDFMAEFKLIAENCSTIDGVPAFMTTPSDNDMPMMSLSNWELQGIKIALKESDGNISLAAKTLGITRSTLYKKIEHFRLDKTGTGLVLPVY